MNTPFYRLPEKSSEGLTSRSSLRIAMLGVVALALFAIVFFRLWFLQVLSGDKYLAQANENRVRDVRVEAPRGQILDRNGNVLVENRGSWQVQVDQRRWGIHLSKNGRIVVSDPGFSRVLTRLSRAVGEPRKALIQSMQDSLLQVPFANATAAEDVKFNSVAEISERQEDFPGVNVTQTFERSYPYGDLGAHLFGNVREVSGEQLKAGEYEGAQQGDRVGQDGLESEYDRYLRGRSGTQRIQVDVADQAHGELPGTAARTGESLRLTVDKDVQKVGENAIRLASGGAPSHGSAFIAMDIKDGAIRGMGSFPSFDPSVYTGVLKQSTYKRLSSTENGTPLVNRAVSSEYPAGSTFKPITSIAALETGVLKLGDTIDDGGTYDYGGRIWQNAGKAPNGPVNMVSALKVSSDVFYYIQGQHAYQHGNQVIQRWAGMLGLGKSPSIDLPGAADGQVPSPKLVKKLYKLPYNIGDNMNLAVGQGYLLVSPLQMAVAYSALGNGGYVVKPHLGLRIDTSTGRVIEDINQPARRKISMNPTYRAAILQGLHEAADTPGGTSYDVFSSFPRPIAGKTGTAETNKGDQSWYVALAPYPNPKYVVAVTVEQGGFGAEAAAPAARLILAKLLGVKGKQEFVRGKSRTL
ncbi:MAG: penicillin-binding protein 2 [Solirubrobacterales bacterium]